MVDISSISLPHEICTKCQEESVILLSSKCLDEDPFARKFCQPCFRNYNMNKLNSLTFQCPICSASLSEFLGVPILSFEEAVLICEATTIRDMLATDTSSRAVTDVHNMHKLVVEKLEAALLLNSANLVTALSLIIACINGEKFHLDYDGIFFPADFFDWKILSSAYHILETPIASEEYDTFKVECCLQMARIFRQYHNYAAALKYSKLAYEQCLRLSLHTKLPHCKEVYLNSRSDVAKLPPLRFAVGDEVEFLHELETGSEWKLGKVVELYYWERSFDNIFSAPYRLQPLDASDSAGDLPVYTWAKADLDRYVRKVGVRSIEDTRYQARLDAKVEELLQVYCFKEFIQEVYHTLAHDQEFAAMLRSVWQIELSESTVNIYRMYVMYRQSLILTDTGYHVPLTEEVIAGIKAYFDPVHLSGEAAPSPVGVDSYSQKVKSEILKIFRCTDNYIDTQSPSRIDRCDVHGLLFHGIKSYFEVVTWLDTSDFVPSEITKAISRVSTVEELINMQSVVSSAKLAYYFLDAWITVNICLENPETGPACECPFVYFFVKYCLTHGLGVPKLALALYDRMNMQLSREFIRCGNPSCELNKLDKSTGRVKFKQCSRCKAVIYCSRECQTAHYPEHKRQCREHAVG